MSYRRYALAMVALSIAGAGCAVRSTTYRLVPRQGRSVLVPPGVARADLAVRRFTVAGISGGAACAGGEGAVALRPRGRNVRVTVQRAPLLRQPSGWLDSWTASAEADGCLAEGAGLKLAARIVESLPFDPADTCRLLHASDRQAFYQDLGPERRLEVHSPVLREGAAPEAAVIEASRTSENTGELTLSQNVIGFETDWYAIRPKRAGIGFTIEPVSAERSIQGQVETLPAPAKRHLELPAQAAFYRLFYKGDQSEVVLAAPTRTALERLTQALKSDPAACEKAPVQACAAIPRHVGVNAFLVVTVNGVETPVPVGSTVGSVIAGGRRIREQTVPPGLAVSKPFSGGLAPVEFDPASPEILGLALHGGERLSWRR